MELTGNLWERVVTTRNASGSSFSGSHGNGILNGAGYSTVGGGWPGFNNGTSSIDGGVNADGLINRGGAYYIPPGSGGANVSYRMGLIFGTEASRNAYNGCRGGRTAP
jgi:hypothetical protein